MFSPDGRALLVRVVPEGWGEPPAAPATPAGPVTQDNSGGGRSAAATYQDMIGSAHEAQLFAHYATACVLLLQLGEGGEAEAAARLIGPAGGQALRGSHAPSNASPTDGVLALSHDGQFVLTQALGRCPESDFSFFQQFGAPALGRSAARPLGRPPSLLPQCGQPLLSHGSLMPVRPPRCTLLRAPPAVTTGRFKYSVDVWSAATGALVSHVADVPLQEAVPTHTD
eukprot:COSAG01_NODE_11290_length_1965_cov_1.978564_1_plen_225_part_10